MGKNLDLQKHNLIPRHTKLKTEEAEKFLKDYDISPEQLPKISIKDSVIKQINAKKGDIIKIERESKIGKNTYYRMVIDHA